VASLKGELIHERFGMAGLPAAMSRTWLASCLADLGGFDEGAVRGEEAVRLAEAVDRPFSLTQAYFALGSLYLRKGDLSKAIPVLERGQGRCQVAHILTWFPTVAAALGYASTLVDKRVPEPGADLFSLEITYSAGQAQGPLFASLGFGVCDATSCTITFDGPVNTGDIFVHTAGGE
jgi:hypothetical protein